jgi:hypothetical protein
MPNVRHPDWRDAHSDAKYPFEDRATLVNADGDLLFEGLLIDASFYAVGAQAGGYISKVEIKATTVILTVGDSGDIDRASVEFDRFSPPAELRFTDAANRPAGVLISEPTRLAVLSALSLGDHEFQPYQTGFVARVWTPVPAEGVTGYELDDGSVLAGDVWLVGDDGVVLTCESVTVEDECGTTKDVTNIRVDVVGDPLHRRALCTATDFFETPRFLESITFCRPAQDGLPQECFTCGPGEIGDIQIVVGNSLAPDTILRVRPDSEGLIIEAVGERLESIL